MKNRKLFYMFLLILPNFALLFKYFEDTEYPKLDETINNISKYNNSKSNSYPKILGLGDSICLGVRNANKGFIGDLGYVYDNLGVGGATVSTANPKRTTIPTTLDKYYKEFEDTNSHPEYPDFIISNGGVNDYYYEAPLGDIPNVCIKTDEEAIALNQTTFIGALQYLFYKMIKYYPKAHRFYILGHKTTFKASIKNKTIVDWTITKNTQGYTQTEMYDAIKHVCKLYGVVPIDIFNKGIINSAFDEYVSNISFSDDPSVTFKYFVDKDRLHPLDYGYINGYIPLIKQALKGYIKQSSSLILKPFWLLIFLYLSLIL